MSTWDSKYLPWNSGGHWALWVLALVIVAVVIHNFVRYTSSKGGVKT